MSKMINSRRKKKLPVPICEVEKRFVSQLGFLQRSMEDYDAGNEDEVLRMAVALRTLLHKTKSSHPLISQIGLENALLISFCETHERNLMSDYGLTKWEMNADGVRYRPLLEGANRNARWLGVPEWQQEEVIILREMGRELRITRWDLVLALANQDGGAHSDPDGVPEDYFALVHGHFGGFVTGENMDEAIRGVEKASVRHMAWEAHASLSTAWNKILGKRGCECNSGRQRRYCCGKAAA